MTKPGKPVVMCCAGGSANIEWGVVDGEPDGWTLGDIHEGILFYGLRYCPWCGAKMPGMEQAQEGVANGC